MLPVKPLLLIFSLALLLLPGSLAAKPLSPGQLKGVQKLLKEERDLERLVKLRLLLIQHFQELDGTPRQMSEMANLESLLSKNEEEFAKIRRQNLYQLGALQAKKGMPTDALSTFEKLLKILSLSDQKMRVATLKYISFIAKQSSLPLIQEKYLGQWVLAEAKSSAFFSTVGGFRELIELARKNVSGKEHHYYESWYETARANGTDQDQKRVLTEWVNFASQRPEYFLEKPFSLLVELLSRTNGAGEIQRLRMLHAQSTPDKAKRMELLEAVLLTNIEQKKGTQTGLLTELLHHYSSLKPPALKKQQMVLELLVADKKYPGHDRALTELASVSLQNKDWLPSLSAHQELLQKNPIDKGKKGVKILDNLIYVTGQLQKEEIQLRYLAQKALTVSPFIPDLEKFKAYTQAMQVHRRNQNHAEAAGLYKDMTKVVYNKPPFAQHHEVHILGALLYEEAGQKLAAQSAYEKGFVELMSHQKPNLEQALTLANRIRILAEQADHEVTASLERILGVYEKKNDLPGQAKTELILAQRLEKEKKTKEAIKVYNQSLEHYKRLKDAAKANQILTVLLGLEQGNGAGKLQRLEDLEKQQLKQQDQTPLIVTRIEIGNYHSSQGNLEKATNYYRRAFDQRPRTPDSLMAAFYAGRNLSRFGLLEEANQLFKLALQVTEAKSPEATTRIHQAHAQNLSTQGQFDQALLQVQLGLGQGVSELTFSLLESRYEILIAANRNEEAKGEIQEQLKVAKKDKQKQALLLLLAKSHLGREKHEEAILALDKALAFSKEQTEPMAIQILLRKAHALQELKKTNESIELLTDLANKVTTAEDKGQLPNIYLQLAGYELAAGQLGPALRSNQNAQSWAMGRKDLEPLILLNFAKISQKQDKIERSLHYFKQLGDLIGPDTPLSVKAEMFYQRGYTNLLAFQFDKAKKDFESAEQAYSELKRPHEAAQSKMAQANVLMQLGKVGDAEVIYQEMLASSEGETKGDINNALAFLQSEMGRYKKALSYSEAAEAAYREAGLESRTPEVLNARGLIYLKMGDFALAEVIFHKAIGLNEKQDNPLLQAELTNNLGGLYKNKGELTKAREQLTKTAELQKSLGFESALALTYNNIGSVYLEEGKFEEALDFLRKSREFSKKFDLKKELATSWNNEGILFFRQNKLDEAKKAFEEAIQLQRQLELRLDMARTLNNLSIIASSRERIKEALDLVQEGIGSLSLMNLQGGFYRNPDPDKILAPDLMKDFLQNKGGFLRMLAQEAAQSQVEDAQEVRADYLDAAYKTFALSIELIESLRSQIQAEEAQQMLMQSNIDVYQQLITILFDLGELKGEEYHEKAFYYAEMSRARSFLDQLAEQAAKASLELPQEIRDREAELKGKIANLDKNIFVELKKTSADRDEALIQRWQIEKTSLQLQYKSLTQEMEEKFPAFASLKYPKVYDLDDVRDKILDDKSLVLVYFVGADRSYGFAAGKDHFVMKALPPNADIDSLIRKYRTTLVDPLIREDEEDFELVIDSTQTHLVTGLQIYRQVLEPLLTGAPEGIEQLVLVPDGVLYYLPFETVVVEIHPKSDKTFAKGREYLLHRYAVNYSPSTSVLGTIRKQVDSRDPGELAKRLDFLGFGDPQYGPDDAEEEHFKYNKTLKEQGFYEMDRLFNTIAELEKISKYFEKSKSVFMRDDALESTVKKNIRGYKYVHFATHGILDERNPEFSGVLMNLVKPDKDDGFLQASEIFELKMNSDLVVLSACETGLGKVIKGEGMVGLTRAFLFAGTPSIVVSLWTVADDSTSKLMIHFYKNLSQGMDKDAALRKAKLDLMNEGTELMYNDPFYWGPFILNGTRS